MNWRAVVVSVGLIASLSGCAGMNVQTAGPLADNKGATWAVLPFANNTETPMANARAAAIAAGTLQSEGRPVVGNLPALRQIEWVGGRMLWSGRALNWS